MEKKSELEISDQSDEVSVSLKSTGKGVRKRDPIKCPQCSKMFSKPSNFKIHICNHTGEPLPKSFQCNVCATMFLDKSVLKRHLSSHVEKSHEHHECVKCNKEYTQLADLREHELEQHGKVIMEDQPPEEIEIKCEIIEISDGDVNLGPNSKAKRKKMPIRPTLIQIEALVEFLEHNPGIAKGFLRTHQAKMETKRKWKSVSTVLNSLGGANKDGRGWAKYWTEKKCALKKLWAQHRESVRHSGADNLPELSELDKRLEAVLGGQEIAPRDYQLTVDPFPQPSQEAHMPAPPSLDPLAEDIKKESEEEHEARYRSSSSSIAGPSRATQLQTPPPNTRTQPRLTLRRRRRGSVTRRIEDMDRLVQIEERRANAEAVSAQALADVASALSRNAVAVETIAHAMSQIARALEGFTSAMRVKKKPDPSKRVQCDRCPKHFESNYLLNRHVRLSHLGERPHMCVGCGKTYTQLGHLRTHELKHNGVKNFNCTECDAAFYRKVELGMHQKIHTGEKNYTCELCPKSFVQKGNLVMHVKTHVGDRRFQCDVCNKMFITNSKLKQHYKRHTKEKTEKGRTFVMMPDDDSIISDSRDE